LNVRYRRYPVYRIILPFLIISSITVTNADSAIQTDWSGGPGVWGPVTRFGIKFYSDSGIACYSGSGDIALGMIDDVVGHNVDDDFDGAASVYSEDIDGDGDMDILGSAYGGHEIAWWENLDGSGTFWTEHTVAGSFSYAESVYSEDIDGDGDMDVLGGNNDQVNWWENVDGTGTSWIEHTVDGNFSFAESVYSEDIDGDGDMDVLGASLGLDEITWWENVDGSGTSWTKHTIAGNLLGASSVYSEDIDGDGDMDVLGAGGSNYKIAWWENLNGSGIFWATHTVDVDFADPRCVYSEDIDGDGDMDVLGAAALGISDDISWWENADGTGTSWIKHIVHGYFFEGSHAVYSADMDNDGDMDILGSCFYEGEVDWFENLNGLGTSWSEHHIDGNFGGPNSIYAEDINGDGIMDILGAARVWDDITWWEVLSYPPEGSLVSSVLDVECSPVWGTIDWSALEPLETSISFQLRSSVDPDSGAMGPWSDTLYVPCSLEGILTDGEQYVQYMVILETSDPDITPTLNDVMLTWYPLGISGDTGPYSFELLPFYPNPTCSAPSVRFGLPEALSIELSIFDVSGRLLEQTFMEKYPAGYHSVFLDEFSPGIYFCRMVSGDFTATQRFVVIE
jgi:hypothetical protein